MPSHPAPTAKFLPWLWKERENRSLLVLAGIIIVIQFTWIKILYPFPNFMPPDSYSYLEAASKNLDVNIWPIGYSRFLRLVSCFSNNHFFLVSLQYILLQASVLYLLFSIRYFLPVGKWILRVMLVLSVANPLIGHISNFVSSDALFTTLSLIWLTQLLWLVFRPGNYLLWVHATFILFAVMVRHSALYYPFISMAIIIFSALPRKLKWQGIGLIAVLLLVFIGYSQYQYKKVSDKVQYSAFAGWQLASNALYGYAYANLDSPNQVPFKFRELHKVVNQHMDSLHHAGGLPDYEVYTYYLWNERAPLKIYMRQYWEKDTSNHFKRWASMGPLYAKYGRYLIMQHPIPFVKYYLWPNFLRYYVPPTKFMGWYNLTNPTVEPIAVNWFGWKNNKLPSFYKDKRILLPEYFSIPLAIINFLFVACFIGMLIMTGVRKSLYFASGISWWLMLVWFSNMVFSVFSAPLELRYQIFPMIYTFSFFLSFIGLIIWLGHASNTTDHVPTELATIQ
jgi:hypothetical protein